MLRTVAPKVEVTAWDVAIVCAVKPPIKARVAAVAPAASGTVAVAAAVVMVHAVAAVSAADVTVKTIWASAVWGLAVVTVKVEVPQPWSEGAAAPVTAQFGNFSVIVFPCAISAAFVKVTVTAWAADFCHSLAKASEVAEKVATGRVAGVLVANDAAA